MHLQKKNLRQHLFSSIKKSCLAVALIVVFSFSGITSISADSGLQCQSASVPVHLTATDTTIYHLSGSLCSQGSPTGKTLEILDHGSTYDHNYWDFPYNNSKYSYVQKVTAAGFATFNFDGIGVGQSDHPDPNLVTMETDAYVIHQLVQDFRNGTIGGTTFSKVILVGHSLGSGSSLYEASTYHDVDGIILTGLLHQIPPSAYAIFSSDLYPANQDPKFSSAGLPDGYLTTIPGARATAFYNTSDADPNVIAKDEQLKQTVTTGEASTFGDSLSPEVSQNVTVPVLLVVGQDDNLFCDNQTYLCTDDAAVQQRENSYYGPQAKLQVDVIPNSGHDLNLHLNANVWYDEAINWAENLQ